jgi:hypothetical protein
MPPPPKRPGLTVLTPGSMPPASQSGMHAHSSIPMSKEIETSTRHKSMEVAREPGDTAELLERLLVATIELPVSNGEEAVVTFMLRAIADIFPQFGVGACLVLPQPDGGRRSGIDVTLAAKGEQSVHKITPPGEDHRAVGMDPTRLFPGYAFECSLESEPGGTTLHLAGDDSRIEDEGSSVRHLLARAAQGMGRGLIFARMRRPWPTRRTSARSTSTWCRPRSSRRSDRSRRASSTS